jgi:hypothetical protein
MIRAASNVLPIFPHDLFFVALVLGLWLARPDGDLRSLSNKPHEGPGRVVATSGPSCRKGISELLNAGRSPTSTMRSASEVTEIEMKASASSFF